MNRKTFYNDMEESAEYFRNTRRLGAAKEYFDWVKEEENDGNRDREVYCFSISVVA